ncbi:MAG: hypothetical protein WC389_17545 [Lutibacter sp.]|jgi:hypothetical protein
MKSQISTLIKGDHRENVIGTSLEARNEIAKKVISENPEKLRIFFGGETIELKVNWSKSKKSVCYHAEVPVHLYVKYFGTFGLPKNDPKAYLTINGDMTCIMATNSRKPMCQYIKESEITIL